ncbi:MAG: septum formation family protein [Mycobacteriales bacterium]
MTEPPRGSGSDPWTLPGSEPPAASPPPQYGQPQYGGQPPQYGGGQPQYGQQPPQPPQPPQSPQYGQYGQYGGPPPGQPPVYAGGQPQYGGGYGPPPGRNGLAIASLILGIIAIVPISIGLAIAALVQTSRTRQKGRGLAIGGIAASCVWSVIIVLGIVWAAKNLGVERDSAGHVTRGGLVPVNDLKVGDCLQFDQNPGALVKVTKCADSHDSEVIARAPISTSGNFTSGDDAKVAGNVNCTQIMAATFTDDELKVAPLLRVTYFYPKDHSAYKSGLKQAICMITDQSSRYTGTLRERLKVPDSQPAADGRWIDGATLQPGQCFDVVEPRKVPTTVWVFASCKAPHNAQAALRKALPAGPYPDADAAGNACQEPVSKKVAAWKGKPSGTQFAVAGRLPTETAWAAGDRNVVCAVLAQPRVSVAMP